MKKWVGISAVMAAALALLCQSAVAGERNPRHHRDDRALAASGLVAGAAGTATSLALRDWRLRHPPHPKIGEGGAFIAGTAVCAALSPIISTVVLQRELTLREAYAMTWDCIIPFIGGWLVNQAFDAHPEWEGRKPDRRHHR